jgi:hypothetical protein
MMDDNPNLLQLRALQALENSSGNTIVLGVANGTIPVVKRGERIAAPQQNKSKEEG